MVDRLAIRRFTRRQILGGSLRAAAGAAVASCSPYDATPTPLPTRPATAPSRDAEPDYCKDEVVCEYKVESSIPSLDARAIREQRAFQDLVERYIQPSFLQRYGAHYNDGQPLKVEGRKIRMGNTTRLSTTINAFLDGFIGTDTSVRLHYSLVQENKRIVRRDLLIEFSNNPAGNLPEELKPVADDGSIITSFSQLLPSLGNSVLQLPANIQWSKPQKFEGTMDGSGTIYPIIKGEAELPNGGKLTIANYNNYPSIVISETYGDNSQNIPRKP